VILLATKSSSALQPFIQQPVVTSTRFIDHLQRIDWTELAVQWGVRLGGGLLLLLVGVWLSKWLARLITQILVKFGQERILTSFLANIARAIVMVVVFIAMLDVLGVPTTSLLAVLGAAGLGIGLALKDSLSNIASGVMLIMLRPFRAGDEVQVAALNGVVDQVRIFQTLLRTYDNRVIILPNSLITAAPITNFTARERRRIDLTIGIGYDDSILEARETLIATARANSRVHADPPPDVMVAALAESSINLTLRAWVATKDYAAAKSELLESSRMALSEHGVRIPFPQQNLHVFHHGVADAKQGEKLLDKVAASPEAAVKASGSDEAHSSTNGHSGTPES
jgi:small-conductance mechanosensitive channel